MMDLSLALSFLTHEPANRYSSSPSFCVRMTAFCLALSSPTHDSANHYSFCPSFCARMTNLCLALSSPTHDSANRCSSFLFSCVQTTALCLALLSPVGHLARTPSPTFPLAMMSYLSSPPPYHFQVWNRWRYLYRCPSSSLRASPAS